MVSGYFGHLESNLRWYFSDVLPGGTFRVSHEPGRGQRPEEGQGRGMNPGLWGLAVYLISRSCLRCSLGTIIHSHYILTSHHHPTYYKSSQKTSPRGKRPVRTRIVPPEDENDIHELRRRISPLFFCENFIHRHLASLTSMMKRWL